MVDEEREDYMRVYKELIDRVNKREDMIEMMIDYIAKYAKKINSMCKRSKFIECNDKRCKECVRNYFERCNK